MPDAAAGRAPRPAPLRFGEGAGMFLWSLAEASFLFLLPEVLLTAIALQQRRRAVLGAMGWGLAGAAAGALLVYAWASGTPLRVVAAFLSATPGISRQMVADTLGLLQHGGAAAIAAAMLQGVPGRLLAAVTPHASVPPGLFLAAFLLGRALLFAVAAAAAWLLALLWRRLLPAASPLWPWAFLWLAFHALWFFLLAA